MTVEYVLLLVAVVMLVMKAFVSAPSEAFKNSGPRLGTRIESHLATGSQFKTNDGAPIKWLGNK